MKKSLLIIALFTGVVMSATAKDLTPEQMKIRLDVVKYLSAEGFKPQIDTDGDVWFEKNDEKYYAIISSTRSNPYLVTLYQEFSYSDDGEGRYTPKNMERAIPIVNKHKTIKLYCMKNSYTYRVDLFCENSSLFASSFYRIMDEMAKAREDVLSFLNLIPEGIDLGNREAVFSKALAYYDKDDFENSFPIFKFLSEDGYAKAYGYMGLAYELGEGTAEDEKQMVAYYEKAIENGFNWCAYRLGNYYYSKSNYAKALANFERCGANENGFRSDALYQAGKMYEDGTGVPRNMNKATQFYRKSVQYAKELECDARLALTRLGETVEKKDDFVDATKTMLMGMTAKKMYDTGLEYEQGWNGRYVSLPKAYAYIKAAADENYTMAYKKMGEIYRSQYYPFNDLAKSDKYYQKAFKIFKQQADGDGDACYELGLMYHKGLGVEADAEQSKYYFKLGALKENIYAAYQFGLICKNEMEYCDAFNFFKQAAYNGLYRGMFELAELYEKGYCVPYSRDKAIEWYTKCLDSQSDVKSKAKKALKALGADNEKY